MECLCRFDPEIADRVAESLSESPDIVLCLLQTVQESEESVTGFVATRRSIRRGCLSKCFLLHGKCRFEINLCGFNTFVTEPQCDHRTIDACLQKIHGHGVPQAVNSDTLVFQRRAHAGSPHAVLIDQVLHAVDAETFTFCVGEQHVSGTSWRLTQPRSQHGESRSSDGCTALLAPLTNYPHVGAGGFLYLGKRNCTWKRSCQSALRHWQAPQRFRRSVTVENSALETSCIVVWAGRGQRSANQVQAVYLVGDADTGVLSYQGIVPLAPL
jgi:hypothetical protein